MGGRLQSRPLGPFPRGVVDRANAAEPQVTAGTARRLRGLSFSGGNRLSVRSGSRVQLTFYDDAGSPALVTSVVYVGQFADKALAIAHSTATNKVYLYVLAPDLSGWYNAAGVLQANANPQPIAAIWSSTATSPDVMVTEGLGVAYIAHTAAADASSLAFPTRSYDPNAAATSITGITRVGAVATVTTAVDHKLLTGDTVTIAGAGQAEYNVTAVVTVTSSTQYTFAVAGAPATPATGTITQIAYLTNLTSDLDGNGSAETLYALGCIAFQQHLWVFGVGTGTTPATHFRPELARFGLPSFGFPMSGADSITLGNRVRSNRERIVGAIVAGDALFLGSPFGLTRVTGFGRTSWYKKPLDSSFGFPGPKCMTVRDKTVYYWSARGPMRCTENGQPEPMWPSIEEAVASVINPQKVVAAYNEADDCILFLYDSGAGVRTLAIYDAANSVWLGPDDDAGLTIRAAGSVTPVIASTAATVTGPDGPPTTPITSGVGNTVATATWALGDVTAQTSIEIRRQNDTAWTSLLVPAGVTSYQFTGLTPNVGYEWRAAHFEGGTYSAYLGPSAPTQFTTLATGEGGGSGSLNPPSGLALSVIANDPGVSTIRATWVNSGESGVSTTVEMEDVTHGGGFAAEGSVDSPAASALLSATVSSTYGVRVKHTKPGYTDSDYTVEVTIAVTVDGLPVT